MTLIKCISLTALLSGAGTAIADSTDNVSSRLQVHVRDKMTSIFNGELWIPLGFVSCFYIFIVLYLFVGPSLYVITSLWIDATCNRWGEAHRGVVQYLGEMSGVGSYKNIQPYGAGMGLFWSNIQMCTELLPWIASRDIDLLTWWRRDKSLSRLWLLSGGNFLCTSCEY